MSSKKFCDKCMHEISHNKYPKVQVHAKDMHGMNQTVDILVQLLGSNLDICVNCIWDALIAADPRPKLELKT